MLPSEPFASPAAASFDTPLDMLTSCHQKVLRCCAQLDKLPGYLAEHGITPRERIEIDGLGAIAAFVNQGLGVSLIPDWTPPWPAGLDVVKLELPPPVPVRRMGLAWMTQGPRAALARAVLKEAEKEWGTEGNGGPRRAERNRDD